MHSKIYPTMTHCITNKKNNNKTLERKWRNKEKIGKEKRKKIWKKKLKKIWKKFEKKLPWHPCFRWRTQRSRDSWKNSPLLRCATDWDWRSGWWIWCWTAFGRDLLWGWGKSQPGGIGRHSEVRYPNAAKKRTKNAKFDDRFDFVLEINTIITVFAEINAQGA